MCRAVSLKIYLTLTDDKVLTSKEKGVFTSEGIKDFPLLYKAGQAHFKFLVNGGFGLYNEVNLHFAQGKLLHKAIKSRMQLGK